MNSIVFNLMFAVFALVFAVAVFIYISKKLRKGGGSLTTNMLGSTYLFYDKERKKAVDVILEKKAGKKMEEPGSEEPFPGQNGFENNSP